MEGSKQWLSQGLIWIDLIEQNYTESCKWKWIIYTKSYYVLREIILIAVSESETNVQKLKSYRSSMHSSLPCKQLATAPRSWNILVDQTFRLTATKLYGSLQRWNNSWLLRVLLISYTPVLAFLRWGPKFFEEVI